MYEYLIFDNKAYLHNSLTNDYEETKLKRFNGDILDENFNTIKSKVKDNYIIGILSTSDTKRFKKNNNNKIVYCVKPLDNNLPIFLVPYGGKKKGKFVVKIKYQNWDLKLPCGYLVDILGLYDELDIETILMNYYNIYISKKKQNYITNTILNSNEEDIERIEYDETIFSIDPDNCTDIDDALSIKKNENGIVIGVHIAQPICWLTENNIRDKEENQFSTLYLNDNNINLWGVEVTERSSLVQNRKRNAYTTLFHYDKDYNLLRVEDFPSEIINNKKLTYNNAFKYDKANELLEFTCSLENKNYDFVKLVSYWMVRTNNYIGEKYNVPYRVNSINNEMISEDLNDEIKEKFKSRNANTAYYSYDDYEHQSLGLTKYCHFTSPIRRIIDTIIHYNITYNKNLIVNLERVNYLDENTKRFNRQMELNKLITSIEDDDFECIGYVYKIISSNRLEVYVKDHGLGFLKLKLYDMKFDYLIEKELEDTKLTLSYLTNNRSFSVGDRVDIRVLKTNSIIPSKRLIVILKDEIISF